MQIICPSCGQSVRARHQEVDGKNVRICAKCGASLDVAVKAEKPDKKKKAEKKPKKAKDESAAPVEEAPAKKPAAKKAKKAEASEVPVEQGTDGKTE